MLLPVQTLSPFGRRSAKAPSSLTPYVKLYLPLEESSGNRVSSVGGHVLTEQGGTINSTPGKIGNGANFSAIFQRHLQIASNSDLQSSSATPIFIWAWVKLTSLSGVQVLSNKFNTGAPDSEFSLFYDGTVSRFKFRLFGSISDAVANSFGAPSTGTYYFVFGWSDGGTNVYIQVNNGTVDSGSLVAPYSAGAGSFKVGGSPGAYLDGVLDEFGFGKGVVPSASERSGIWNGSDGVTWPI